MIVVVDDHWDTGRALVRLLRYEGIPAEHFEGGAAALAAIESLNPSLLVLDQMMPGMMGTDVLRAIRAIPAFGGIPAIFYSASLDGKEEARRLGALDWILKGQITWPEVRDRIVAAYNERRAADSTDQLP